MAFAVPAITVWEPFNCIFHSAWIRGEQDIYLLWPGLWLMQLLIPSSVTQSSLTSRGCSVGYMSLRNFFKDSQNMVQKEGSGSGNAREALPPLWRVASSQQLSHPSLLPLASAEKVLFPCSAIVSNRPLATSLCRAACNVLGSSCPLGESQERHLLLLDT